MSEMVERVKAAMHEHVGHDNWVDDWDKVARAAIAAMREPSDSMVEAARGNLDVDRRGRDIVRQVWQDGIDEALR